MSLSISSAKNNSILRYLPLVFPIIFLFFFFSYSFEKVSCLVLRKKKEEPVLQGIRTKQYLPKKEKLIQKYVNIRAGNTNNKTTGNTRN